MDKKLRVFRALAEVREGEAFTVPFLIAKSGVNPQTVRTVLSRHSYLFEEAGKIETRRRGGQITRYRLTAPGRSELEHLLRNAETADLKLGESGVQLDTLAAAAYTLFHRFPEAHTHEERQRFLLEMVALDLNAAWREIEAARDSEEDIHEAEAEWEELNACHSLLANGHITDRFMRIVKQFIVDLALEASSCDPNGAAARFRNRFERLLRFGIPEHQLARFIASLRSRRVDWLPLDRENILWFGSSPGLYRPNALNLRSSSARPQDLELRVMLLIFLGGKSGEDKPSPLVTALELAAAAAKNPFEQYEGAYAYG